MSPDSLPGKTASPGTDLRELSRHLACVLGLRRQLAGVGLIPDRERFEAFPLRQVRNRVSYCTMVMLASREQNGGYGRKAAAENLACPGAAHVFGFQETTEFIASGRKLHGFGLYADMETARRAQADMARLAQAPYGVAVAPLPWWSEPPQVVIAIVDARQAMRLVQGYAHQHGVLRHIRAAGNQGICSECTAAPLAANDMNVSLLCSNTRFAARWSDAELGVGMPFAVFERVAAGVLATVGPAESEAGKREIATRYATAGIAPAAGMTRGPSYFTKRPR